VNSDIRVGDVVVDLAQSSLMQVVGLSGMVEEHAEREGYDLREYACHPLFDVQSDEPIWNCVYLGKSLKSLPDASYDFPDSRLARVPVEEANERLQRVQDTIKDHRLADAEPEEQPAETPEEVADGDDDDEGLGDFDEEVEGA